MRKFSILLIAVIALLCVNISECPRISSEAIAETADDTPRVSLFEKAVEIIKKYETLHQPKHWPLVGYGHKVLPGEKFSRKKALSEAQADALLRKDLKKNCALFREFGADSLLLGVLAYNIGSGATMRSSVVKKLKAGNRDIRETFIAHCRYRGKPHTQIRNRRIEEFDALFILEEKSAEATDNIARKSSASAPFLQKKEKFELLLPYKEFLALCKY